MVLQVSDVLRVQIHEQYFFADCGHTLVSNY